MGPLYHHLTDIVSCCPILYSLHSSLKGAIPQRSQIHAAPGSLHWLLPLPAISAQISSRTSFSFHWSITSLGGSLALSKPAASYHTSHPPTLLFLLNVYHHLIYFDYTCLSVLSISLSHNEDRNFICHMCTVQAPKSRTMPSNNTWICECLNIWCWKNESLF